MATVAGCISQDSQSTAIIIPSTPNSDALEVTYRDLASHTSSLQAHFARLGLQHEDAVAIVLPNTYPFIVSFLASTYQRLKAAPINSAYKESEFDFYFRDLAPALILVPKGAYASNSPAVVVGETLGIAIAECYWNGNSVVLDLKTTVGLERRNPVSVAQPQPEDVALVLHTSGTTGRPKAVPLSHRNIARTIRNIQATYELTNQDRTMIVMPLFHVHGLLAALLAPLGSGGSAIVPEAFHASTFWHDFTKYQANWYSAVPTIHTILLRGQRPSPIPNIRFIRSSSAALSPTTFYELEKAFNAPVLESYGMTEATHQIASNPLPYKGKRRPGCVGLAQGGVEVKILDAWGQEMPAGVDAEICIRGENVMLGYIDNPTANKSSYTADGFFRTGDQGRKDADGYIIITGRIKEMINRAGEKISPTEIDQLVLSCPDVLEACSFAVPSEMYGEEIGVAVVPKSPVTTEKDIREYVGSKAVKFKVPKKVWIISTIPKTPTGKVQRLSVGKAMLAKDIETTVTTRAPSRSISSDVSKQIIPFDLSPWQEVTDNWWSLLVTGTVVVSVFVGMMHVKARVTLK